jgi:hypothetical protein
MDSDKQSGIDTRANRARATLDPGLCADCVHAQQVMSARDSKFYLCRLSASDPRFPKYPRLPVLSCKGYEAAPESVR